MSDPLKENEALESELIEVALDVFYRMKRMQSPYPKGICEKHLRPRLRLALLKARHAEAERCDAYGKIGSPRKLEIESAINTVEFEVAKLKAQ